MPNITIKILLHQWQKAVETMEILLIFKLSYHPSLLFSEINFFFGIVALIFFYNTTLDILKFRYIISPFVYQAMQVLIPDDLSI